MMPFWVPALRGHAPFGLLRPPRRPHRRRYGHNATATVGHSATAAPKATTPRPLATTRTSTKPHGRAWTEATVSARRALQLKGFTAINGKSVQGKAMYVKAKTLMAASRGA
ncbi:unnamed protein product [Prorocentrum cordatum]|uniref:Fructose-bisphosphate aldolase n=1 Tax=Prorocentrum cordatum TaxID=2364126 RepID=A0ABN9YHQ4_9DINO|nr:unnamed protein product [Polarella glacialis]